MKWTDCRKEFVSDGSLRDVYVKNVTLEDWEQFYQFLLRKGVSLHYERSTDKDGSALPSNVADIFKDRSCVYTLSIHLDGILLNCHFFNPEEIELDLDPKEINSHVRFNILMGFLSNIGQLLRKEVILTPENCPEVLIFRYLPDLDTIIYESSGDVGKNMGSSM